MIFRALDALGDWTFGRGKNNYLTNGDALAQNLKTRLRLWKGECFFAVDEGVDWDNFMGVGTKALLDSDIKRVILASDGVLRIDAYTSTLEHNSRTLTVDGTIGTVFGKLSLSEVF